MSLRFARLLLAAPVSALLPAPVFAQSGAAWPARPVRFIVPYAPGGGVDTVTRAMAQRLGEQLGGSFLVDNRPGGGGVVGTEQLVRAAPDGHTLLASATDFATNPALRGKLPYEPLKDFAFVSQLASVQFVLGTHPSVPVRNVRELIALAKARPGQLTFGSSGIGAGPHFAGALFQSMAGIRWTHVPFKGAGPATIAVFSGEVDFVFGATIGLLEPVRAGRIRAVAVTGPRRFASLPDVPTVDESGVPGYIATGWYGLYAPAATPPDLVRRIYNEALRALGQPELKERLARAGNEYVMSTPDEFAAFVKSEIAKWTKVARETGMKAE